MSGPEDEVRPWPKASCSNCRRPFPQHEGWARECFVCYKTKRKYDLIKGDKFFLWAQIEMERLQEEVNELRVRLQQAAKHRAQPEASGPSLDEATLKSLLILCHPDKHDNSQRATEVTQKLLDMRKRLKN